MKMTHVSKLAASLTIAGSVLFFSFSTTATPAFKIIGLTSNNVLVRFGSDQPTRVQVSGLDGNLQCIDFRPANGLLYGVTDTDKIYTINPNTGNARFQKTLSTSFNGGFQSGCDFNPVLDRLRLVGSNKQNFSVNVDDGTATPQTPLAFVSGDPNSGIDPNITGGAYTNSRPKAPTPTSTQLFDIDYDRDVLVLQDPPNGTLTTVGSLGVNFAPIAGFDIFTDTNGRNFAFAISGSTIYSIDLSTGAATKLGNLPSRGGYVGLAVNLRRS
jgi:hypothetical protein